MKKDIIYLLLIPFICLGCNQGSNVTTLDHPASSSSRFPSLHSAGDALYMSWLSHHTKDSSYSLNYARYAGHEWGQPRQVARDRSWFVNWADFPSILADEEGSVAVHWLDKIPGGTYAYNVNMSVAGGDGQWSSPITPHMDHTATEHGFVSMIQWDEQTILVVWLDGRQSEGDSSEDYYNLKNAMTLRGALVTRAGEITDRFLIDEAVCDCCPTSLIKTPEGAMVAYRNRTGGEIRDIYVSRFNGVRWGKPEPVYRDQWKIGACPVNGPELAAEDSLVVLSWFTGADEQPSVQAALSGDGGASFGSPVTLDSNNPAGRVGAAILDGTPYVSWIGNAKGQKYVKVKRLGATDTPVILAGVIDDARRSGVPQLVQTEEALVLGWTTWNSKQPQVKLVKLTP